jgi:membrane protease YdiL (CAAX protease family)
MFVKAGIKGRNDASQYLLTISIVVAAYIILGYIPMYVSLYFSSFDLTKSIDTSAMITVFGNNLFLTIALFPFIVVLLTLIVCIKIIHKRNVLTLFTIRESFDWKRFFFSFSVWGSVMAIFLVISFLAGYPIEWNFDASTFFMLFFISIFILPLQTTCEEVLFRGYLLQGFGSIFKRGVFPVVITGVLFGLMHGANPEVEKIGVILLVYYIVNGLFLGVVALMDDGLELTMGYHAINNIFAALIVTNNWQAFHTDALFIDKSPPSFGIENIITLIVIQPLLLVLFAKKYKWTNWKQRLFYSLK